MGRTIQGLSPVGEGGAPGPAGDAATSADRSATSAVALLVAGAFFMENLDGTVIVTALPRMAAAFGVNPLDLNVGVSAYLLTLAVLIPASGWLVDRFGARPIFSSALLVFTGASVLCGLSRSLAGFTLARILQGAGGAMMVPVGRLVVLRTARKHELITAIATITWPGLAAPVLGPPLGGLIVTYASWRWIFFLNVPLGLAAWAWALRLVPRDAGGEAGPFDGAGFALTGAACFGLMYGLEQVSRSHGSGLEAGLVLLAAVAAGCAAVRHAGRKTHPLLDFRALAVPSFAVTVWGGTLFRMAISAVPFLLPLLFQLGFGLDPFHSGLLVLAVFAGNLAMKPLTTPVLRRFPFRATLLVNVAANAACIFGCALLSPATPRPVIAALLFASGLTRSMQFTALNTLAFAEVPEGWMSGANTLFNLLGQMALAMGIALGATALRAAGLLFPGHAGPGAIPMAQFHLAFVLVGVVALLEGVDVLRLPADAGDSVRIKAPEAPAS